MELTYKYTSLDSLGNTLEEAGFSEDVTAQSICYSCLFKGSVIGHLVILNTIDEYLIASLYVVPMFRGLGISTKLLNIGLSPLFESEQKRIVLKLCTKTNSFNIAEKIAYKNQIKLSLLEPILFVVKKNCWIEMIQNVFGDFFSTNRFKYKTFSKLSKQEINKITDYSVKHLPYFLQPFAKFDDKRKLLSIFIFDQNNNIKAWSIVHCEKLSNIYIECTYVMPDCRKNGLGILSWEFIRHRLQNLEILDQVKKISFAVDTINPRAYKLFNKLTKDILYEKIQHYKLLPLKKSCNKC